MVPDSHPLRGRRVDLQGEAFKTPPAKETQEETGNLLTAMGGNEIRADEADTAQGIRGLSRETEQYAQNQGTPAGYKEALDRVLSLSVTEKELDTFLVEGKIGEYAP